MDGEDEKGFFDSLEVLDEFGYFGFAAENIELCDEQFAFSFKFLCEFESVDAFPSCEFLLHIF